MFYTIYIIILNNILIHTKIERKITICMIRKVSWSHKTKFIFHLKLIKQALLLDFTNNIYCFPISLFFMGCAHKQLKRCHAKNNMLCSLLFGIWFKLWNKLTLNQTQHFLRYRSTYFVNFFIETLLILSFMYIISLLSIYEKKFPFCKFKQGLKLVRFIAPEKFRHAYHLSVYLRPFWGAKRIIQDRCFSARTYTINTKLYRIFVQITSTHRIHCTRYQHTTSTMLYNKNITLWNVWTFDTV